MVDFIPLIFVILFSLSNGQWWKRKKHPPGFFPPLTNYTEDEVGKPAFVFEGVLYEELPPKLKKLNTDCPADYMQCSVRVIHHHPVCGYDVVNYVWLPFHSICELDYANCLRGKGRKQRRYYYLGDGYDCEAEIRPTDRRRSNTNKFIDFFKNIGVY